MIDVNYLIANLDEVLGDNMFLKDVRKAENLKGSIHSTFNQIKTQIDCIESRLSVTENQTFSDMEELNITKEALKDYLRNQIDLNQRLLRNLGEWY